ncbi:hypothetical protein, partial [Pseudomonas fluorescens]|uniref:hypothetical protein n=1 Tax=Pseudomonas fluorescens TaxID=294 RepID=UPI001F5517BE
FFCDENQSIKNLTRELLRVLEFICSVLTRDTKKRSHCNETSLSSSLRHNTREQPGRALETFREKTIELLYEADARRT